MRSKLGQVEMQNHLKDLGSGLKNMLMCLSYSKQGTLRNKVIKILKKMIKQKPQEMLEDEQVHELLKLRITDVSSLTRESILDIIYSNLDSMIGFVDPKVVDLYISLVIQRADQDDNLSVRKRVI